MDEYVLCAIPNEGRCLEFVTNIDELIKCGMGHKHVNKSVNAEIFNYPVFMTVKEHPLYADYIEVRTFMMEKTGNEFEAWVRQKIEREPSAERKTRSKCKARPFFQNNHF